MPEQSDPLRDALLTVRQIVEDEAYKVTANQSPCKHTDALNEIHAVVDEAIRQVVEPSMVQADLLLDPNVIHVNMLRGSIAKPSLKQIIHIYGAENLYSEIRATCPDTLRDD